MIKDIYYFSGIGRNNNLVQCASNNHAFNEQLKTLNERLKNIASLQSKEEKVTAYVSIVNNSEIIESATSNQLMHLFSSLRNLGNFENMIKLYHNSNNLTFKQSLMVNEFLMVAYNKCNMPDNTIELSTKLIASGKTSGDVYGAQGKAYLLKSKSATSPKEQHEFLVKSLQAYESGFLKYAEFYPGINAVYRYIELGQLPKAQQLANLVYLACKKEGAEETNDYWCTTTKLEASCIAGKSKREIVKSLQDLLKYDVPAWQFQTTKDTLQSINQTFNLPIINDIVELLNARIENQTINHNLISAEQLTQKSSQPKNITTALLKRSYNYRGLASNFEGASSVSGNFRFGGQLPDHSISRKDIEIFDGILHTPAYKLFPTDKLPKEFEKIKTLSKITDTKVFLTAVDTFIRYHYGTENFTNSNLHLESNAEINNSIYDQTVNAVITLSGKSGDKLSDSRTNISSIFAIGMGDCRHHAQVKQLMFDRWQGEQMKDCLVSAYKAISSGNKKAHDIMVEKFNEIYSTQLRTLDVKVNMPIEINGMYNAQKTADGKFIANKNNENVTLEEHTMTMLVNMNNNGVATNVTLADAFYQNNYNWANHNVPLNEITLENNEFSMNVGNLPADKVNTGNSLPITLTPAVYAGKRDTHSIDEHGNNLMLLGIPIKINNTNDMLQTLQSRQDVEKSLTVVREEIQKLESIKVTE